MPLTPSSTRDLLAQLGHHPKRFLGQNFLVDGNIVRKSLELAQISAHDHVLEVGPGLGTLTSALLETGAHVYAVEKDDTLHAYLAATLVPQFPATLHLLHGDAIDHPRATLPESVARSGYKIVANLPYAISTPWMDAILSGPLPDRMVMMLQQEAAQRYSAGPGTKQFSGISIFLQAAYELAPGHKVSAACFHPRPDIESYLLHLVRRASPFVFSTAARDLIRSCFQQRRKQIAALLRDRLPDHGTTWIDSLSAHGPGLGPKSRPEEIPVSAWKTLTPA